MRITDPSPFDVTPRTRVGSLAARVLVDPRDAPMLALILVLGTVLLPFAAYLFLHPGYPLALIGPYAAILLFYVGPFTGLIHEMSHRTIFRSWAKPVMHALVLGLLAPLYGLGPSLFRTHHVGMHHPENNLADDLTSTQPYRRDSVLGFTRYYFLFLFLTLPELLAYQRRHGHGRMMRETIRGGVLHAVLVAAAMFANWRAALPLLIGSIAVTRFVLAAGNWAQHAFIDREDPADPLRNSTTCINTRFNHVAFNGGYHTTHHERVRAHWSERPALLARDLERYRSRGAVVFEGIDFGVLFLALMTKRYAFLARHRVLFGDAPRDQAAIVVELRRRTEPIPLRLRDSGTRRALAEEHEDRQTQAADAPHGGADREESAPHRGKKSQEAPPRREEARRRETDGASRQTDPQEGRRGPTAQTRHVARASTGDLIASVKDKSARRRRGPRCTPGPRPLR